MAMKHVQTQTYTAQAPKMASVLTSALRPTHDVGPGYVRRD